MNKVFLIIVLCSLNILSANAQKADLVFSSEKFLQKKGTSKLKILKNGNTACIEMNTDDVLICRLFDTNKKKVNEVKIELGDKLDNFRLRAVLEINKDLVVMFVSYPKKTPQLTRLIFDGTTGQLKSKEIILEMSTLSFMGDYAIKHDNIPIANFIVEKDPLSDYYAIVLFNPFADESNKRIEVVHYSPVHEVINRGYFLAPDNTMQETYIGDLFVNADKSIVVSTYAQKISKIKSSDEGFFYISQLKKGASIFTHKSFVKTNQYLDPACELVFNKISGNVNAIAKVYLYDGKNSGSIQDGYSFTVQSFNPVTMEFGSTYKINLDKLKAYYAANINPTSEVQYNGLMQNFIITPNGNSICLTEYTRLAANSNPGTTVIRAEYLTMLNGVGLTTLTPEGNVLNAKIIPYQHEHCGPETSSLYMNVKKGSLEFSYSDEFDGTCIELIPAQKNNYLLLNNTPGNFEKAENVKPAFYSIKSNTPNLTTCLYTIDVNGVTQKDYLFGKPTEGNIKCALLNTADYDPETGLYVTQVVEKINGEKKVSIVWFNLN
jgi:hypothetical protein